MNKSKNEEMYQYNEQILIGMEEVLSLIDEKYDYAQDPGVIALMDEMDIPEKYKHLINRRYMLRYFDYYNNNPRNKSKIRIAGSGTKGTKYYYNDIIDVISDPDIDKRINEQLKIKTRMGLDGIHVPEYIFFEYCQMIADIRDPASGCTPSQIDLMSVDDVLLEEAKEGIEKKIQIMNAKVARLQERLNDINEELNFRKDIINSLRACDRSM